MTFRLDRLEAGQPITSDGKGPSLPFQVWAQRLIEAIEAQETAQDAVLNRIRRISSHTVPTTMLTASDNGTTATITVADHVRVYADGTTVSVTGDSESGLVNDTTYGVGYIDTDLAETAPTYIYTQDLASIYAAAEDGMHFCGVINTPAAGSGDVRAGGGAYPAGSSVGGEV